MIEQGQEKADLADFLREHQSLVNKIAYFYSNNREEREDNAQEIIYNVCRAYPSFRGDSKASTWIYRIAINTCINSLRRKKITTTRLGREHGSIEAENELEQKEKKMQLRWAIEQLNEAEKTLVLLYLDEISYKEIGSILGFTENAVAVKMHRLKSKLKNIMDEYR